MFTRHELCYEITRAAQARVTAARDLGASIKNVDASSPQAAFKVYSAVQEGRKTLAGWNRFLKMVLYLLRVTEGCWRDSCPNSLLSNPHAQPPAGVGRGRPGLGLLGELDLPDYQRCSRCKAVRYCSTECQREDWRWHRSFCKRGAKAVPSLNTAKYPVDWDSELAAATSDKLAKCDTPSAVLPDGEVAPQFWAAMIANIYDDLRENFESRESQATIDRVAAAVAEGLLYRLTRVRAMSLEDPMLQQVVCARGRRRLRKIYPNSDPQTISLLWETLLAEATQRAFETLTAAGSMILADFSRESGMMQRLRFEIAYRYFDKVDKATLLELVFARARIFLFIEHACHKYLVTWRGMTTVPPVQQQPAATPALDPTATTEDATNGDTTTGDAAPEDAPVSDSATDAAAADTTDAGDISSDDDMVTLVSPVVKLGGELPRSILDAAVIMRTTGHERMRADTVAQTMTRLTRGPQALLDPFSRITKKSTTWAYNVSPQVTEDVEAAFSDETPRNIKTLVASVVGTVTCSFKAADFEPNRYVFMEDGLKANLDLIVERRKAEAAKLRGRK